MMKRRLALVFALLPLVLVLVSACEQPYTPPAGEVEAAEFLGTELTPINEQNNNALRGTQYLDRETYQLSVDGLVAKPLTLSYDDLLSYPQESRLTYMPCVEGWGFLAKWTGPRLRAIFDHFHLAIRGELPLAPLNWNLEAPPSSPLFSSCYVV